MMIRLLCKCIRFAIGNEINQVTYIDQYIIPLPQSGSQIASAFGNINPLDLPRRFKRNKIATYTSPLIE